MSQVFGDPKRLVNDYMAASHAIGITGPTEVSQGQPVICWPPRTSSMRETP